jgi:hypothetical protein
MARAERSVARLDLDDNEEQDMTRLNWIQLSLAGAMVTTLAGSADARPFF